MKLLRFFWAVISTNVFKSLLISIWILCIFGWSIPDDRDQKIVKSYFTHINKYRKLQYYYITYNNSGSSAEFSIDNFDKEQKITKDPTLSSSEGLGTIIKPSANFLVILSIAYQIIAGLVMIVMLLMGLGDDDEVSWNFKKCWYKVCSLEVSCEEEDGYYYYQYKGRLLEKNRDIIDTYTIRRCIEKFHDNGPNLYPEYQTKSYRRNKLLKDLFPN